jgi:uncharacterized protein (DUF1015 family)
VPILRPFRALRFDTASVDLSAVLAPPYDVISPAQRLALLEQDPRNAVRIDLPTDVGSGDTDAYRAAARTVAEWRSAGILVKDRQPTVTMHEMSWRGRDDRDGRCLGLMARLRLEAFGPGGSVLPHERTFDGPREDRYQLLRSTGLNSSPVVLLAGSDPARTSSSLEALVQAPADSEARTADGVSHRLWIRPTADPGLPQDLDRPAPGWADDPTGRLLELLCSAPLTIADGHHRYETALRYRTERGANRACESDPAWDYVLALIYPLDSAPPILPTHRVVRADPGGEQLIDRLRAFGSLETLPGREALLERMAERPSPRPGATGSGRIGLLTTSGAAILTLDREAIEALLPAGLSEASRGLDVNALGAILERTYEHDAASMAGAGRLWYVKDALQATAQVEAGAAAAAYLLDGMDASALSQVAEAGELMPHKSTYFDPKAPSGLLFNPLEW